MDESSGNLIIVSGMSGAGRSSVADVLEDLGWFVVDNLPPMFLTTIVEQVVGTGASPRLAVVVDVRTGMFFDELGAALEDLRTKGYRPLTLFLEASDDVIVRRQESVRRPHPLQGDGRLLTGIERERELLGDMRFVPNPYWQPDLRPMTGQDKPVSDFVLGHPLAQQFLQNYVDVLDTLRTGYLNEGKRFVTVAIGCTGGKHRSVAMAEEIGKRLREKGSPTLVVHRDLGRE